jgi:hypothetical protein
VNALRADEFAEWEAEERAGTWSPPAGDALHECVFEKAGFRSFRLVAPDRSWVLELGRVDVADREPKGIVTVAAPHHPAAFPDLDDYVLARSVGIFGGRNMTDLVKSLTLRLGAEEETWTRRLDYLCTRSLRELQATRQERVAIEGLPGRPVAVRYVFEGRLRVGRTISLFGPGSSGKTTITAGLVVSLTSGREVVPGWLPTRRFTVGVLDWDEGEDEERVRLYAICRGHGLEIAGYRYARQARPLAESADEVGRWVTDEGIEVLIVSPVNRALRPAFGDPGIPVFELYEVLREFGTTNILIDHVTGANVEARDAAREYGSVAKRDAARGSYSLYEQFSEPGRRVVVLRNTKPDALAPRHEPQAVAITFNPAVPPTDGVYEAITFSADEVVEVEREAHPKKETQPEALVRVLRDHGPQTTEQVATRAGFRATQVREIARKARARGYHVNYAVGKWALVLPSEVEQP